MIRISPKLNKKAAQIVNELKNLVRDY
jgi:hypothetical protein